MGGPCLQGRAAAGRPGRAEAAEALRVTRWVVGAQVASRMARPLSSRRARLSRPTVQVVGAFPNSPAVASGSTELFGMLVWPAHAAAAGRTPATPRMALPPNGSACSSRRTAILTRRLCQRVEPRGRPAAAAGTVSICSSALISPGRRRAATAASSANGSGQQVQLGGWGLQLPGEQLHLLRAQERTHLQQHRRASGGPDPLQGNLPGGGHRVGGVAVPWPAFCHRQRGKATQPLQVVRQRQAGLADVRAGLLQPQRQPPQQLNNPGRGG